jgi:hypothetical protein
MLCDLSPLDFDSFCCLRDEQTVGRGLAPLHPLRGATVGRGLVPLHPLLRTANKKLKQEEPDSVCHRQGLLTG